jgi:shikimate dehydrogenase
MRSASVAGRPELFGIIGYPLLTTWSPHLHNTGFQVTGLPHHYAPFAMPPGGLGSGVKALATLGVRGFNVTVPHKETILQYLQSVSPLAQTLGASNTVVRTRRGWHGENTDVHGFAVPLWPQRRKLAGRPALVFGAGGAARAVVYALIRHFKVSGVLVLARQSVQAERFARWAQSLSPSVPVSGAALGRAADWRAAFRESAIVVNATPVGSRGHSQSRLLPAGMGFRRDQIAYDLVYGDKTDFLKRAEQGRALTHDGSAMLGEQAAAAFRLFTGRVFPKRKVFELLRRSGVWPTR